MGNNEFEKVRIKKRTSYHFDETMKREDFDIYNILIDGKSRENIFIYDISWKALIGPKSLRIRFNKIDEFIWIHDGTRYYDVIYDRIRHIIV